MRRWIQKPCVNDRETRTQRANQALYIHLYEFWKDMCVPFICFASVSGDCYESEIEIEIPLDRTIVWGITNAKCEIRNASDVIVFKCCNKKRKATPAKMLKL